MLLRFTSLSVLLFLAACKIPGPTGPVRSAAVPLIPFERDTNQTCTWQEAIQAYEQMAAGYPQFCQLRVAGKSDGGHPIHLFVLSSGGLFKSLDAGAKARASVILINNGIHPGEPEGIDASILFARKVLTDTTLQRRYRNLVFLIIPIYNVDGARNRGAFSRANQNGPASYGFRGNARNLDLNRDFIKCDSENARSFTRIFQEWQPDLLIDNHTSNGADYQYTMTLLATLSAKLAPAQARLLDQSFLPFLYTDMAKKGWPMAPYVNEVAAVPDSGILAFLDLPRFASGYAALHHCIGLTPETHMLKPFGQRLRSTESLLYSVADYAASHQHDLQKAREEAKDYWLAQKILPVEWQPDMTEPDSFLFRGYEARYIPSQVHKGHRLYYDRSQPFEKNIPYYRRYTAKQTVRAPQAYVIPQAWREVIDRLRQNQVTLIPMAQDTALWVTQYRIKDFQTRPAYEGHYLHYQVQVDTFSTWRQYFKGDYIAPVESSCNRYDACPKRYLIETLEPTAPDSWFAWGFFDGILMQKEWFSDYVFEDLAADWLNKNPELRAELDAKMAADTKFAQDKSTVLRWVYERSPWYEPSHRVYPVARIE